MKTNKQLSTVHVFRLQICLCMILKNVCMYIYPSILVFRHFVEVSVIENEVTVFK